MFAGIYFLHSNDGSKFWPKNPSQTLMNLQYSIGLESIYMRIIQIAFRVIYIRLN